MQSYTQVGLVDLDFGDTACQLVEIEQILEPDHSMQKNISERVANVQREKSNNCNLCDYASSHAGHLRTHLKTHIGEKLNKCNQCDFASIQAGDLRTHLKTHTVEKSQTNVTNVTMQLPMPAL